MTKKPKSTAGKQSRRSLGRSRDEVTIPIPPLRHETSRGYGPLLDELKQRIAAERVRVVLAANSAMVVLYWDIGQSILQRQEQQGWGTKVIDRLSADLRDAFPDMSGLSPRNLKYMPAFAETWPDRAIVQEALAQITWYHHYRLRCFVVVELKAVPFDAAFVGKLNLYLSAVDGTQKKRSRKSR